MKTLLKKLKRKGVFYEQVKRTDGAALYSLRYAEGGPIIGFDVFKVHRQGESHFKGNTYPSYERFPRDSDYGSSAFSFNSLKAAEKKFLSIT
jgi:hypothetical protein